MKTGRIGFGIIVLLGSLLVVTAAAQMSESGAARGLAGEGLTMALAADDIDGDGDIDVFEGNYHGFGTWFLVAPSRIYQNDGLGNFTEVPDPGFPQCFSAAWFDMEGDGDLDVLLIEDPGSPLRCYRNEGGFAFAEITASAGLDGVTATSLDVCDFDGDTWLDVVLSRNDVTPPAVEILKGDGDTFSPYRSWTAPTTTAGIWDLVVAFDWDRDLDPDIFIHDSPAYTGYDPATYALINEDGDSAGPTILGVPGFPPPWGAPAWADADLDGAWDFFCGASDFHGGQNHLMMQGPAGSWTDVGETAGLWSPSRYTSNAAWGDFDLDGLPDLFQPRFGAYAVPTVSMLYRNTGGRVFEDATAILDTTVQPYAVPCSWFDADGDGDLELLVGRSGDHNASYGPEDTTTLLFLNQTAAAGNWLQIDLVGLGGNRLGRGAEIAVYAAGRLQLATPCQGSAPARSQTPHRVTVGLGDAAAADSVVVRWPSGMVSRTTQVAANQVLVLEEEQIPLLPAPVAELIEVPGEPRVLTWAAPEDPHYAETCVFVGTEPGFPLDEPVVCTMDTWYIDVDPSYARYVVRHRDVFGRYGEASEEIVCAYPTAVGELASAGILRHAFVGPNPFNPATTVSFELAEPCHVAVGVYDLKGRRVKTLADGPFVPGRVVLPWNGDDAAGARVASGPYMIRIDAAGSVELLKCILLP